MSLKINLPFSQWNYKISGVYKIQFDSGNFYIGCSNHLRSRASQWDSVFRTKKATAGITIGTKVFEEICKDTDATLDIVELCAVADLKEREAFYLDKFKDDEKMVSSEQGAWKPVLQYTKDGNFVKKHYSLSSAARYCNTEIKSIQRVVNGARPTFKGMVFIYEQDYHKRRSEIIKSRYKREKKNGRSVIVYNLEGNEVARFRKIVEAGRFAGVAGRSVRSVLCGMQKTAGGHTFKYEG